MLRYCSSFDRLNKYRERKVSEILSRAVMSGRQRVDTQHMLANLCFMFLICFGCPKQWTMVVPILSWMDVAESPLSGISSCSFYPLVLQRALYQTSLQLLPHWKHWKNELEALSCSFCTKRWSFKCSWSEKRTAPCSELVCEMCSFNGGPPSSVYLGTHWRHSRDKMDQAFPFRFCILQKLDGGKA